MAVRGSSIAVAAVAALSLLSTALPATAAPAVSRPSVKYFRASAKSLSAAGGKVRLSAAVKGGKVCRFTSSPSLTGLPASVSCASGAAERTVQVPANKSAGQKTYKFGLTVTGPGGKTTAKPLAVAVREEAPSIADIAMAPSDLPSAGGATVLSAMVSRSAKCTVSASPAVAGLPVTTACASGSAAVRIAVPVALTWNDTKWSAPDRIETGPYLDSGYNINVSCVSDSFCLAVDASGNSLAYNGDRPVRRGLRL